MFTAQVEACTKLFPAVFVRPTTNSMFQFEFGCIKVRNYLPCLLNMLCILFFKMGLNILYILAFYKKCF